MKIFLFMTTIILWTLPTFSQNLYDIDQITEIEIEFNESNWDAIMDQYMSNDLNERLVAQSVSINGISYDSVGIKFKGNSSYSASNLKNPLNIKLNYILDQNYDGYETFKLSNGFKDPSFVREVLSYEIARKYMDAPLSNYAKVYINGNYYGLFVSNESINSDYVERRFYSDKDNPRFKCNPNYGSGGSPSLEYLGTDSSLYFNSYELKSEIGWNDLVSLTNVLAANVGAIETYLDVDRALWMLAFNNILVNLDSYSGPLQQNYYLVKDDNGRFLPIVWDLNQSFASFTAIDGMGPGSTPTTLASFTDMDLYLRENDATYPLIYQLLSIPRYKKMYTAHCRTILAENFANNDYYTRAQAIQNVIATEVQAEPNGFYTYASFLSNLDNTAGGSGMPGPGSAGVYGLSELMNGRVSYLQSLTEFTAAQPVITNITTPTNIVANTAITITAEINNATFAYLGYRDYIGAPFTKTEMFDDGLHNDGAAGDQIYGVSLPIGASDLQYYIYADNADAGIFSPVRAEHEFYDLTLSDGVVINEIMTKNNLTVADQDGEYNDWVELYNNSSADLDLSGYYLSDSGSDLLKWSFPSGTSILANDYLIVWLDKDTTQAGLHANFKISSSGDDIFLSDASGVLISEVQIPQLESSTTFGRYPNGTGGFIRMVPTYNGENSYTSVSVEELPEENLIFDVSVFPNPTHDFINISCDKPLNCTGQIFELNGKLIQTFNFNSTVTVDLNDLTNGMYLVVINSEDGQQVVHKIMKQ